MDDAVPVKVQASARHCDEYCSYPRPVGHARARSGGSPMASVLASRLTESQVSHQIPGASGSVNRSSSPGSVRHMSVTSVVQRRLLTKDDGG
jgi:hypothetical protein